MCEIAVQVDFQMSECAVNAGQGGLFLGLVQALTEAAQDLDVHIHKWLRVKFLCGAQFPSCLAESSLWCPHKSSAKSVTESGI